MSKIKGVLIMLLFFILLYTRFVNLSWGLPYPFDPDERNMAVALKSLKCEFTNLPVRQAGFNFQFSNLIECGNPHFFAYGQFPLYLGFLGIQIYHLLTHQIRLPVSFEEAILSLRIISALSTVINVFVLIKILELVILKKNNKSSNDLHSSFYVLAPIFSPFFIQFSHFGTTESLLMLFYSSIVYLSLLMIKNKIMNFKFLILNSLLCGLAIATKVSSLIFIAVPICSILLSHAKKTLSLLVIIINFFALIFIFSIVFSPHNLLSFEQSLGALRYESDVALGRYVVFYTRQFVEVIPVIFQFLKVFPYTLGGPALILGILGFLGLSWKSKEINLLRFAFFSYFIPNAFLFTKWTRFMAPVFPLMLIFAILFLLSLREAKRRSNLNNAIASFLLASLKLRRSGSVLRNDILLYLAIGVIILPGLAYLSIYQNSDVRFTASDWIYKNIPENSYILSETANVVDIPIETRSAKHETRNYTIISFNFYDLDANPQLQEVLKMHLQKADYIFVPSRRVFKNHPKEKYPVLWDYYEKLFSGKLGFQKVAEFSSYPKIELFGKTLIQFPDENAEETWSVFDHPVVRIYKRF